VKATATFPDGRTLSWEDGRVSGHPILVGDLEHAAIRYSTYPAFVTHPEHPGAQRSPQSAAEQIDQPRQLLLRKHLLNQGEELAFLETNVLLKFAAELVQRSRRRCSTRGCLVGEVTDPHVIGQNLGDERMLWIDEAGAGRQKDVLLLTEVLPALGVPVSQEAVAGVSCT
jgi:hypothetical protein